MKLKRFVAKDMRSALALIKEELGPDAVIMSNKRIENGVEIVAGVENSAPSVKDQVASRSIKDDEVTLGGSRKASAPKSSAPSKQEAFAKSLLEILERQKQEQAKQQQVASSKRTASAAAPSREPPAPLYAQQEMRDLFVKEEHREVERKVEKTHGISSYISEESESEKNELSRMRHEVDSIRRLLQFDVAGLMADSKKREEPVRAMVYELLLSSGFEKSVAHELAETIDADASFNFAWRELAKTIEHRLIIGSDEVVNDGGIVTLIGPAGVGKTTTLAKLAARFVMKYGADRVALVTADHYRIGAVEQVKTYGRIMGCSAFAVKSLDELPQMLHTLRDKSLVLVDTVGVGLYDERFGTQLAELKQQSKLKLKHYLVLPATAQRRVLEQAYDHFSSIGLKGLILTKIDESESLADALSLCIKQKLMLSYITDGQRVPEDLSVPVAKNIAVKALSSVENDVAKYALDKNI